MTDQLTAQPSTDEAQRIAQIVAELRRVEAMALHMEQEADERKARELASLIHSTRTV